MSGNVAWQWQSKVKGRKVVKATPYSDLILSSIIFSSDVNYCGAEQIYITPFTQSKQLYNIIIIIYAEIYISISVQ
jgi:hypothetical protein